MVKSVKLLLCVSRTNYVERVYNVYYSEVEKGLRKEKNDLFLFHVIMSKGMYFAFSSYIVIDLSAHPREPEEGMIESVIHSIVHEYLHHVLYYCSEIDEEYQEIIIKEMLG